MRLIRLLLITTVMLGRVCFVNAAEQRIVYSGLENTTFTTHFMEKYWGGGSDWISEMISEVSQSSITPHSGSYSMLMDVGTNGNPHASFGYADSALNTEHFYLQDINSREFFFRNWMKSNEQAATNFNNGGMHHKFIYINYQNTGSTIGDFVFVPELWCNGYGGTNGFHILLFQGKNYSNNLINSDITIPSNLFDEAWHEMEYYINLGTDLTADGVLKIWVDGVLVGNFTGIQYSAQTFSTSPVVFLEGWPSNMSGTALGPTPIWWDDFEVFADTTGYTSTTGTMADGTITAITGPVDGLCGDESAQVDVRSYGCATGTSTSHVDGVSTTTWDCEPTGGGTVTDNCSAAYSVSSTQHFEIGIGTINTSGGGFFQLP